MRRLILLILLAYGLFILGLITLSGELLALTVPLVVYLLAALLHSPTQPQLTLARTLSVTGVPADTPVEVTLTLTNAGDRVEEVWVRDRIPEGLRVEEGETELYTTLAPGASLDLVYTVRGPRGSYRFRTVDVVSWEHLGLIRRQRRFEAPKHLLVLPEVLRLQHLEIRPLRTRGYAGPIPSRIGGSGVNFFGVREYQMGDPQRWINWRASARHSRALFTNEFEQERIADVGIILDARQQTNVRWGSASLFEYGVEATAALAETFLKDGNRVGLLVYGRGLERTFPGYGKVQRERILHALAYARPGASQVFEGLDYLPARFFPPKSQIVFVSPLAPDDREVLVRLRAHGYQVLVISPDPVSYEARLLARQKEVDPELATRIARAERTLILRRLRQVGIQVVDWPVHQPFDGVMHASLGRPPRPSRILRGV
jgi:uncharacterized protein (DUF58 family)